MSGLLAGFRLELRVVRANPDSLIPLITAPLFAIIFLAIVRQSGRADLEPDALMAPVLMSLWWIALVQAGSMITSDRWQAVLEPLIASPTSLASVLVGRVTFLICVGLLSIFGVTIPFEHPLELALTLLATAFAMSGTAVAFAALFVMTRNAYTFINSASFPFYVLGGVLVPVAFLPDWIEPLSSVLFLSWSADLLRATLKEPPVDDFWARLGMVVLLGTITFALGRVVLFYVLRRMCERGELATA
jgi:ABC-2 type transport system permease protein